MDVDVIAGDALAEIEGDWAELVARDASATPFQGPAWAGAWLQRWEDPGEAWIVRVRSGGRVVGLVPLTVSRRHGARVLGMLGKEPGDYWDVVAAEPDRAAVAQAAAGELQRRRADWDLGILSCLQPGSPTVAALGAGGLRVRSRVPVRSPHIALPDDFDAYLAALPNKHRSNLRRHLRKLDGGDVQLRRVTDAAEIPAAMDRWRDLRSRQWRAAGREINALHEEASFTAFMSAVACSMVPLGSASLWEFVHADRVAGVYLNFHDDRAFYWYLGGFEPELSALGVGKIAIAAGIRESIAAGRTSFDFTRGTESYKYWYGAVDRELGSILVGHDGVRSRLAMAAARGVLALRSDATAAG